MASMAIVFALYGATAMALAVPIERMKKVVGALRHMAFVKGESLELTDLEPSFARSVVLLAAASLYDTGGHKFINETTTGPDGNRYPMIGASIRSAAMVFKKEMEDAGEDFVSDLVNS